MKENYKVVIWGFGSVGKSALEIINKRESLTLVGVYDPNPAKVGKDAGLVMGLEEAGVLVSDNKEEVLAIDADVALYYASSVWNEGKLPAMDACDANVEDICALLKSGKNTMTTVNVYYSKKLNPDYYNKIDAAAKEGNVTYTQLGIFPGFFTPYLPTVLGHLNRKIEQVIVYGGEDDSGNTAPWVQFFCYGKSVEDIPPVQYAFVKNLMFTYYGPTAVEITERLGLEYDEFRCDVETVMSDKEVTTPNAHVTPGTIGCHSLIMATYNKGKEVVGFHFNHKASADILEDLPINKSIVIKGEPNVKCEIDGIIEHHDPFLTSASPNVNFIPSVVDAPAGYVDALDLPVGYMPK